MKVTLLSIAAFCIPFVLALDQADNAQAIAQIENDKSLIKDECPDLPQKCAAATQNMMDEYRKGILYRDPARGDQAMDNFYLFLMDQDDCGEPMKQCVYKIRDSYGVPRAS